MISFKWIYARDCNESMLEKVPVQRINCSMQITYGCMGSSMNAPNIAEMLQWFIKVQINILTFQITQTTISSTCNVKLAKLKDYMKRIRQRQSIRMFAKVEHMKHYRS